MPKINKSALVPFSAKQMYSLVNRVDEYQEFLPGCRESIILEQNEHYMKAKMVLVKAGVEQVLVTSNTLIPNQSIQMALSDGPFKKLSGGWVFTALSEDACKIELSLDFTFTNKLVDLAFGKVFRTLTNNMVKAFTQRAREIYQ